MRALARPSVYGVVQRVVRGGAHRLFVEEYVRPRPGERVLDIGCGPAGILEHLHGLDYLGIDQSEAYVKAARRRYGGRAAFVCSPVSTAAVEPESFDLAIAYGVLHHLDDAGAADLYSLAHRALRPGGRLITLDGCFVDEQSRVVRVLLTRDRGEHVRKAEDYLALVPRTFEVLQADIRHDALRIPYTVLVVEMVKPT